MGVSKNKGTPKWRIWGYHYFRKHSNVSFFSDRSLYMSSFCCCCFFSQKKRCPNGTTIIWVPGNPNEGRVKPDGLFNRNLVAGHLQGIQRCMIHGSGMMMNEKTTHTTSARATRSFLKNQDCLACGVQWFLCIPYHP